MQGFFRADGLLTSVPDLNAPRQWDPSIQACITSYDKPVTWNLHTCSNFYLVLNACDKTVLFRLCEERKAVCKGAQC